MVGALIPRFASLTTKPTHVDQGEGVLLHRPLDVLFQEGVSGLAGNLQLTTSLLQFVVQDWFQQQSWAAHSVHRLEGTTPTSTSPSTLLTLPSSCNIFNHMLRLTKMSILKHLIRHPAAKTQYLPPFESYKEHQYSTSGKQAHSFQIRDQQCQESALLDMWLSAKYLAIWPNVRSCSSSHLIKRTMAPQRV